MVCLFLETEVLFYPWNGYSWDNDNAAFSVSLTKESFLGIEIMITGILLQNRGSGQSKPVSLIWYIFSVGVGEGEIQQNSEKAKLFHFKCSKLVFQF